jgi:hypothetical protein
MRPPTGAALAAALACVVLRAGVAHAEPKRVLIESSCAPSVLDLFELLYLLRVELPPDRVQVASTLVELGSPPHPDLLILLCADDSRLERLSLRVADAPAERREVDLSALPANARARALALALAEIIETTPPAAAPTAPAAEVHDRAQPMHARPSAAAPNAARVPTASSGIQQPTTVTRVGAALASRVVALPDALDAPTLLYGPALSLDISRWHVAAVLLRGQGEAQLGTIAIASATGAAAYDVWRNDGDEVALAARVRGELGVTWATGEARAGVRARSAAALAASALVELAMLARLAARWALDLRIGSGYARGLGALASGSRSAVTHGVVLGVSAGLSWELP